MGDVGEKACPPGGARWVDKEAGNGRWTVFTSRLGFVADRTGSAFKQRKRGKGHRQQDIGSFGCGSRVDWVIVVTDLDRRPVWVEEREAIIGQDWERIALGSPLADDEA